VKDLLLNSLFIDSTTTNTNSIFKSILNDVLSQSNTADNTETPDENEIRKKKKIYLIFDNVNLIVRHLDNNPFRLIQFLIDLRRHSNVTILMILHEDSLETGSIINQFALVFQTLIKIESSTRDLFHAKNVLKFNLKIENRNSRNFKMINHVMLYKSCRLERIFLVLKKKFNIE
jgi:hypothetical protein